MKKAILILVCFVSATAMAQTGFGVKAGLNYGDNGEISYRDVQNAGENIIEEGGDSKVGYHVGVFYRKEFTGFFLKPELLYTRTKSSYAYNNKDADYEVSKIDLPVLAGLEILGPINVFAGPSFQYVLDNEFEGVEIGDVEKDFTVGAHFGAGVQLGGLGLEVRYERGLTENETEILDETTGLDRVDTRPSQLIFSVSLVL